MARRPLIAGNWKLNLGPKEAGSLANMLKLALAGRGAIEVAVFPSAVAIVPVVSALTGSGIEVGIQEVHDQASGAFTGANSPVIAREAGCTRVLIGHSERRSLFGETDSGVNRKIVACLKAGLLPVVCVGETLEERDAGRAMEVVIGQVSAALRGLESDQLPGITLAYEPVWAIGTGRTASPEQAQEVHAAIRSWLRMNHPAYVADQMRILYGGSVNAENAASLLSLPDIDGALVGGASLKTSDFAAIVAAAGK